MKQKKLLISLLVTLLLGLLILSALLVLDVWNDSNQNDTDAQTTSKAIPNFKPFTVLLLGIDTGTDGRIDQGNSDTLMVATIDPQVHRILLYSIPRDTMAQIIGVTPKNVQKINAAYNIGGAPMAQATVATLLNIPINYYATINMGGLKRIVNLLGGVTVNIPFSWQDPATGDQQFQKGWMHLDGDQALAYVRMRHEDPNGDYGRQKRQQQLLKAIAKKALTPEGLLHIQALDRALQSNVKTDLSFSDLLHIFLEDHKDFRQITTAQLQGEPAWINQSAYQIISTQQLQASSNRLRKSLNLPQQTLTNLETQLNTKNSAYNPLTNPYYQTFGSDTQVYTN